MEINKLTIVSIKDENGIFTAWLKEIPAIVVQANSKEEIRKELKISSTVLFDFLISEAEIINTER